MAARPWRRSILADRERRHRRRPGAHRSRVDRGRAVHGARSRADPARGARGPDRRLRLRHHRLPAEPRPADRQRPGRGERRDHPGPDAVLRDEGPDQPGQGHQRDPPQAQPDLRILGLLPTFYDGRTNLAKDMLDELRVVGDHHVFNSIVRNTVKLGEAPLVGRPITSYAEQHATPHARTASWPERWWNLARPDFRAAAARRLSEERELSPAIVSLLSPDSPTRSVGVRIVPIDHIEPNPEQPRLAFNQETLDELAASIREHGVLQPILVRPDRAEPVPAHRRRAPLAGVEAGRPRHHPGAHRGHRRRHGARDLDHREPPARGHLAPRRSGDVRPDGHASTATASASWPTSWARTRATSRTGSAWPTPRTRSGSSCPCAKTRCPTPTS